MTQAAEAQVKKNKGNEHFKAGDMLAAITLYEEAIRLDPGNALLYTNCAQAHLKLGAYESALERCDIAIRADEKCVKAHLRRGIALRSMGEYKEAVKAFKQAKMLAPSAKEKKAMDRHIDETKVAQEIAESEVAVAEALNEEARVGDGNNGSSGGGGGGGSSGSTENTALKTIERGASKMALLALQAADYASTASELIATIKSTVYECCIHFQ